MKLIIEYHMKNSEHLNEHHVTQEWRTLKNIQNEIMELKDLQILLQLFMQMMEWERPLFNWIFQWMNTIICLSECIIDI